MKNKILLGGLSLLLCLTMTACGNSNENTAINSLSNQLDRTNNSVASIKEISESDFDIAEDVMDKFADENYADNLQRNINITKNALLQEQLYKQEVLDKTAKIKNYLSRDDIKLAKKQTSALKDLTNSLSKYNYNVAYSGNEYNSTFRNYNSMKRYADRNTYRLNAKLNKLACNSNARCSYYENLLNTLNQVENVLGIQDDNTQLPNTIIDNKTQTDNNSIIENQNNKTNIDSYQNDKNSTDFNTINTIDDRKKESINNDNIDNQQNINANNQNNPTNQNYQRNRYQYNNLGRRNIFNPNRNTDTYGPMNRNIDTYRDNNYNGLNNGIYNNGIYNGGYNNFNSNNYNRMNTPFLQQDVQNEILDDNNPENPLQNKLPASETSVLSTQPLITNLDNKVDNKKVDEMKTDLQPEQNVKIDNNKKDNKSNVEKIKLGEKRFEEYQDETIKENKPNNFQQNIIKSNCENCEELTTSTNEIKRNKKKEIDRNDYSVKTMEKEKQFHIEMGQNNEIVNEIKDDEGSKNNKTSNKIENI